MNNNFRTPHHQHNNNLINGYNNFTNNNTPFVGNSMLSNNPAFIGSIRAPNFQNKINMMKMEQRKKIKSIGDLNLTKEQLFNYIIDPIKVAKQSKEELNDKYHNIEPFYLTIKGSDEIPKILRDWWESRKNTPYKNILKNENYTKSFNSKDDLIVHKVTQLDKDEIKLMAELEEKMKFFESHDGELKMIYSLSKEASHAKDFEYVQKYKHRISYNPENYNDLKQYYKKEQKRINKENQRIDEMLELLIVNDNISKEDLDKLEMPMADDFNDVKMNKVFKKGEQELEKQLEKQLRKELGNEQFDEVMNQCCENTEKPRRVKVKIKEPIKSKNKGTKETKETEPVKKIGQLDNSELEKYKNRKKIKNT